MADAWGASWGSSWGSSWASSSSSSAGNYGFLLPEPYGISFDDWGARVSEEFAQFCVPAPFGEDRWVEWACSLFHAGELTRRGIPSPIGFTDWRTWAQRFLESMR